MSIRVLKLKKGTTYQAVVRSEGRRLTRLFDRRGDAERWLRAQLDKRDAGDFKIQDIPTLSEFAADWLKFRKARIRPSTLHLNEYLLRLHILPKLGHLKLNRLTPSMIEFAVSESIQKGLGIRTANIILALLRKAYNDAIQSYGYRILNPALKVANLKEQPRRLEFWSTAEVQAFLQAIETDQPFYLPLMRFILNTGVRSGEAFALQWQDVDLEKGFVCVRRTVDRIHHVVQETTKGNKLRYVGLNKVLMGTLTELSTRKDGHSKQGTGLVFPNSVGGLMHHSDFQRRCFDKCVRLAGVRKVRVHDLRHTFAAHFVMNGGSIYDLKQILGHSDIKMTERYAHLGPDYLRSRTALVDFS